MKKMAKAFLSVLLAVCVAAACGSFCSCKSSDTMYQTKAKKGKVINKNLKMRGNNSSNGSTYRTY